MQRGHLGCIDVGQCAGVDDGSRGGEDGLERGARDDEGNWFIRKQDRAQNANFEIILWRERLRLMCR